MCRKFYRGFLVADIGPSQHDAMMRCWGVEDCRALFRKRIITIAALVFAAIALYVLYSRITEPRWKCRTVSAWLRDFDAENPQDRDRAAIALREIGTNAIPFIIDRLRQSISKPSQRGVNLRATINHMLSKQSLVKIRLINPKDPRHQALAAVDALGPTASNVLPSLEKLLHETPPDPRAPYVIARLGQVGDPVLRQALTNDEKFIRMAAQMFLTSTNLPSASEVTGFDRRICEFNLKMMTMAFQEYVPEHPEMNSTNHALDAAPNLPDE